jgi:hypothetical protein
MFSRLPATRLVTGNRRLIPANVVNEALSAHQRKAVFFFVRN